MGKAMKKFIFAMAAAIGIELASSALVQRAIAKGADEVEIEALEDAFAKAVRAKDIDAIMKVYVPDETLFVFDVVPPREYVGAKSYRDDWKTFLSGFSGTITMAISDLAVTAQGSLAFSHSVQRLTGTGVDGKPIDVTVRVTDDYHKINGKWLIVQEHVSVPVDLATGKADTTSKL
jgi:ketosteroid isomerase-like protein